MVERTYEEQLSEALDLQLLDLIKNGRVVLDGEGIPILGPDGCPMRKQPTAADFGQALKRLASGGKQVPVAAGAANEIRKAMESGELKLSGGGKLPPVDQDDVA
jgi:hypothetical protein